MALLYCVNLSAAALLALWPLWFSRFRLRLPILNPFTITLGIGLPVELMKLIGGPLVLLDDGLFDKGYQFAVLATNVLVLSQLCGVLFFFNCCRLYRIDNLLPFQNLILSSRILRCGSILALCIYGVAFYLLASAEFGVFNWIVNPREGYQLHRTGQGHWYGLAITALSVSLLLSLFSAPTARTTLLKTPIYLLMAYLLGSKLVMLSLFTSILIFLWFIGWRSLTKTIVLGTPLIFSLLVINLFLALSDNFDVQAIFEYFDYYKNAADYYRAYLGNEIDLFWGEVIASSFASYIPRSLWPEKPFVYGVLLVNEIFYPGQAELTNTPAFGGAVEQFADFGFPGVILSGFFGSYAVSIAITSHFIFRRSGIDFKHISVATIVLMFVQFVPTFGMFFPGGLYFALLFLVSILLALASKTRRRRTIFIQNRSFRLGTSSTGTNSVN